MPIRVIARCLAWPAGSPLSIEAPGDDANVAEDESVASALRAAIGRVGVIQRTSVDVVTSRLQARQIVDEVTDALSAVPKIKWLGALLQVLQRLVGRGCVRLIGYVLESEQRGPGLALSLNAPSGSVIAAATLWAVDYEPLTGSDSPCEDARSDRLLRLATAGAVWTHFAVMSDRRGLRAQDFADTLGASDWQSYASLQIGVDARGSRRTDVNQAHYAKAVDRDPDNLVAQFNLAGLEGSSTDRQERRWALQRLQWVHERLETQCPFIVHHRREAQCPSHPAPDKDPQCPSHPAPDKDPQDAGPRVLDVDPLHYQVLYKLSAMQLNEFLRDKHAQQAITKADLERDQNAQQAITRADLDGDYFEHLTEDLIGLEESLEQLDTRKSLKRPDARRPAERQSSEESLEQQRQSRLITWWTYPARYSAEGETLLKVLRGLEGPLLVLWMALNHQLRPTGEPIQAVVPGKLPCVRAAVLPAEQQEIDVEDADVSRRDLIKALKPGGSPGDGATVVLNYLRQHGQIGSRTRYNLACYFADIGYLDCAWRELSRSLEDGTLVDWAREDPELAPLRKERDQWTRLMERHERRQGLGRLDSIDVDRASQLRKAGIEDLATLVSRTDIPAKRQRLANSLNVGLVLVERWAKLAELATTLNASTEDINQLDHAGVADPQVFSTLDPDTLSALLNGLSNDNQKQEPIPRETLTDWIDAVARTTRSRSRVQWNGIHRARPRRQPAMGRSRGV